MSVRPYKHKENLQFSLLSETDEGAMGRFINARLPEKVIDSSPVQQAYKTSPSEPRIALKIAFLKIYFASVEEVIKTFARLARQKRGTSAEAVGKIDFSSLSSVGERNALCKIWLDWLLIAGNDRTSFFPEPWLDFRNYVFCKIIAKTVSETIEDFKDELLRLSSEIIREYPVNQYSMIFYSQLTEKMSIDRLLDNAHRKIVSAADQADYVLIDFLTKRQHLQGEK